MKRVLLALSFVCIIGTVNAQKIKFQKEKVLVDGIECMNYDSSPDYVELTSNQENQTIILKFVRIGEGQNQSMYTKVIFVEQEKSLSSKSYTFTKKLLVKKLIEENVLQDCTIDQSKINKFVMKYDEGIEESIMRIN